MQPHVVYLANTTGLKVGITRAGRTVGRWLDQGAVQGPVICRTDTRRQAGLVEVALAATVKDRADWRALVSADAPPLDLQSEAATLRQTLLALDADWTVGSVVELSDPVSRYGPPEQLTLKRAGDGFCWGCNNNIPNGF